MNKNLFSKKGVTVIFAILLFSASFWAGRKLSEKAYLKKIEILNSQISVTKESLNKITTENNELKQDIEEIKTPVNPKKADKAEMNKTDYKEAICLASADTDLLQRNCIINAKNTRKREIDKEYKLLKESQEAFVSSNEANETVLKKILYETPGLIHTEIAQSYSKDAVEERAEFLGAIYYYYYEKNIKGAEYE